MANKMYLSDTDATNKVEFEINPWVSVYPAVEKTILQFKSIPSWDDSGNYLPPVITHTDFGGREEGGSFILSHEYMTKTTFDLLFAKYISNSQQTFRRYYADGSYQDYTVLIKNFTYDYIQGTEVINWKMELIIVEVI